MTLRTTTDRWVKDRQRRNELTADSAATYRRVLRWFADAVGDTAPESVRRRHVERWLAEMDCGPATVSHRLSVVRSFFRWAVEVGVARVDPTVGVKGPRRPKAVPRHVTVEQVRDAATRAELRVRCMVILAAQLGVRRAELARMQVGDIDRVERTVLVRGKGRKERVLHLTDEAARVLGVYLLSGEARRAGPLFPARTHGGHLSPMRIGELISAVGPTAHQYRHTCATGMLRHGASIRDVQYALGHESIATTERYLAWVIGDLAVAMEGRAYLGDAA